MRIVLSILVLATLAACSGRSDDNNLDTVCAEQSALARNGTVDGGQITITCPN